MNEATDVAKSAAQRAGEVTGVLGEQAKQVASETGAQAKNLLDDGVNQIREQAREGQQKLAEGLRGAADQLRRMADRTDDSGLAPDLVRQATDRTEQVAQWLESREPGDLIEEVRRFARRRPGMFLLGATVAGVLAGRLTRNIVSSSQDSGPDRQRAGSNRPADDTGWQTQRPDAGYPPPESPAYAPGASGHVPPVESSGMPGPVR